MWYLVHFIIADKYTYIMLKQTVSIQQGPVACVPVPYRTTMEAKCMQNLTDQLTGKLLVTQTQL